MLSIDAEPKPPVVLERTGLALSSKGSVVNPKLGQNAQTFPNWSHSTGIPHNDLAVVLDHVWQDVPSASIAVAPGTS